MLDRARAGASTTGYRTVRLRRDGTPVYVSITASPLTDATGRVTGAAAIARDVSSEREVHEQTMHLHSYLGAVLAHLDNAVLLTDPRGRIAFVTDEMLALSGLERPQITEMTRAEFLAACSLSMARPREFLTGARNQGRATEEKEVETRGGQPRVLRWHSTPVSLPDGLGRLDLLRDVTPEVRLRESLAQSAVTDALTGLLNRRGAGLALERERQRAVRSGTPLAVALLDVDRFKVINDRLGHPAGDAALQCLARTVNGAVRGSDLVARWGGDELLVVFPDTDIDRARLLAERVRRAVSRGCRRNGAALTVSAGLACLEPGEPSMSEVLERADRALYRAKELGRDRTA
jgi:diguanylate cyclase (GGDEF)-like protein